MSEKSLRPVLLPLLLLALLCALPAGVQSQSGPRPNSRAKGEAAVDPTLWPEAQRSFWQDGPALLLTDEQRQEFLTLDSAGRDQFIQQFLSQDPVPETPANEMREGIARRQRLAALDYLSPLDVRSQLLFLNGAPAERKIIDCGNAFRPLEIWTWRGGLDEEGQQRERKVIVYRPQTTAPYELWTIPDGKRALYTDEMGYFLDQIEALGSQVRQRRIDLLVCKDTRLVDLATGIEGMVPAGKRKSEGRRKTYGIRPWSGSGAEGGEGFLDPPGDLAWWAREAMKTDLADRSQPAPALPVSSFLVDFPDLQGQRMITRVLLAVPPAALQTMAGDKGEEYHLLIEGEVEQPSGVFEEFRMRFKVPAVKDGAKEAKNAPPVALPYSLALRSDQKFLMRIRVKDEVSGAETLLIRGFQVPRLPAISPEWSSFQPAEGGEAVTIPLQTEDSLVLLPPTDEVVFGLWRAEALVTGEHIQKVRFLLDGKEQVTRGRPPFTAEIRLPAVPTEGTVRAEGYDADGKLVAADEVVLNRPREAFRVEIKEPAEGKAVSGRTKVVADVVVPEGRKVEKVDISLNDKPVTSLTKAPWEAEVDVPNEEIVYVTVAATLDNDDHLEQVRFLRAPENLEHLDVQLVELYTTVVDRGGQPVRGLTADDFEVLEEGKPQPLAKFEQVENLPLTLGIVLDTSGSMEASLSEAQRAAADFLKSVAKPKDRAFAMHFSGRPQLLIPPTDDIDAVAQSLQSFQALGMTALHDAIVSSLHYFRSTRGQRALVLLSDGDDTASAVSYDDALEYARRSGVAIYTIGLKVPGSAFGIRNKLNKLSETTGGRSFYIAKAEELSGVYGEIEQELRSRYLLAFQTEHPAGENVFRPIEVRVKKPGLKARAARGYYP